MLETGLIIAVVAVVLSTAMRWRRWIASPPRGALVLMLVPLVVACGSATPRAPTSTPASASGTGIAQVDHFLELVRRRDIPGMMGVVGFVPQMCGYRTPEPSAGPVPCRLALGDVTPETESDQYLITSVPVFTFDATCSASFLTEPSDVKARIKDFFASHPQLSIYGVGRQSAEGKNADGYVVLVTASESPSPTAAVSFWYLRPDGQLISVHECADLGSAAEAAGRTGALAAPVLTTTTPTAAP